LKSQLDAIQTQLRREQERSLQEMVALQAQFKQERDAYLAYIKMLEDRINSSASNKSSAS
jgi:hypothetical protein